MSSIKPVAQTVQLPVAAPDTRGATIARHALVGGAIGAIGGAALSLTALPVIGALSAPIAAAIGGVAGLVIGGIVGLLRTRSAPVQAAQGAGQLPPPVPTRSNGTPPPPPGS